MSITQVILAAVLSAVVGATLFTLADLFGGDD